MTAPQLSKLMNPRSVAIVGASPRPETRGFAVLSNLTTLGFDGPIYPVNPRYEEVAGLRCYPSLSDLPEPADAVFIGIAAAGGPDVLDEAAACGIRAAEINASGYADAGGGGIVLQERIRATAARYGMAICGPNNVGVLNVHDRTALWTTRFTDIRPGPMAIITQSGSASLVLTGDPKHIGIAYAVASGNEAVLTAADYLDYVVQDDRVKIVLMFLETIRDPSRFAGAALLARSTGKRIIVLKVGRSESGKDAALAHTNSIAGDDRVYEAYFRKYGIVRVNDFDEMLETAALFNAYPSPPATPHVVPITTSGGETALIADLGAQVGVSMPALAPATVERLRPGLSPYVRPRNPVDGWGLQWDPSRFRKVLEGLITDEDVGVIVPAVDAPVSGGGDAGVAREIAGLMTDLAPRTTKRFVVINNTAATGTDRGLLELLKTAGIPCLVGMSPSLRALSHWTAEKGRGEGPSPAPESGLPAGLRSELEKAERPSGAQLFEILSAAGVPMVGTRAVTTVADAIGAAADIGYPVVLKADVPAVAHKAERGLVRLHLHTPEALRAGFESIERELTSLGDHPRSFVIQAQVDPALELIAGVRIDPNFGPVTVVGMGGVNAEAFEQASVRLGVVDSTTALEMFSETVVGRLLAGRDGRRPLDAEAAASAVAALSRFGATMSGLLSSVEVNPLLVLGRGQGAVGVDVLIEWASATHNAPAEPTGSPDSTHVPKGD